MNKILRQPAPRFLAVVIFLMFISAGCSQKISLSLKPEQTVHLGEVIPLPAPALDSSMSVEKAISMRRSVREFKNIPLSISEVAQLLWAAQGITSPDGGRTAPSAGTLYPLEIYLVAGNVESLQAGVYHYLPFKHALIQTIQEDVRTKLTKAALDQNAVNSAPASIIISANYQRTTGKYGERGARYVHMEVGFAAQNIYLQAESLGLGTVFIGAFYDDQVKDVLKLPEQEEPLGLMPVGEK